MRSKKNTRNICAITLNILLEDFMSLLTITGAITFLWVVTSLLNTMLFNMGLAETGSWNFFQILVALKG